MTAVSMVAYLAVNSACELVVCLVVRLAENLAEQMAVGLAVQ